MHYDNFRNHGFWSVAARAWGELMILKSDYNNLSHIQNVLGMSLNDFGALELFWMIFKNHEKS